MASTLETSKVCIEEISKLSRSVVKVKTAIPAFIGYTQIARKSENNDLIGVPTRITSLVEYITYYGGAELETDFSVSIQEDLIGNKSVTITDLIEVNTSKYLMYYAMQMYFANGGGPCYIISVARYSAGETLDVKDLREGLDILKNESEPTLIVFPDAVSLPDAATFYNLYNDALGQCADLQDRFTIIDTYTDDSDIEMNDSDDASTNYGVRDRITSCEEARKYGAIYFPYLKTKLKYQLDESSIKVTHILASNENVIHNNSLGELNNKTLEELETIDQEVYNLIKSEFDKINVVLPPSSSMAGVYTKVDSARGVWRSPVNVFLNDVEEPTVNLTDMIQRQLNVDCSGKSINTIRSLRGRGVAIEGARTLLGNDNEWRYIAVRRFFNMIDESIKKALKQFVLEPNDANTWAEVGAMIETFLINQWEAGALVGATPNEAFYVRVGLNKTMTVQEVFNNIMNIEIGLAVVQPKDFIELKFSQKIHK